MPAVSAAEEELARQLELVGHPAIREFRFHPVRKWRFDLAFPDRMLAFEVEGGIWVGGRHQTGAGFEADIEKYTAAVLLGWRVLRGTPRMVRDGTALKVIEEALGADG